MHEEFTGDAESDWRDADDPDEGPDTSAPYVRILSPAAGEFVPNPVTFEFEAGPGVENVWFECDEWPLQDEPIPAGRGTFTYLFSLVNIERRVVLIGLGAEGLETARDEVRFTPTHRKCAMPDQPGFNHYTIAALNDWGRYPKDGTYPYCWSHYGDVCGEHWGMVHDGAYLGEALFPGGGDCFCSGHTLEIFLRAYRLWQIENAQEQDAAFEVDGNILTLDEVDIGPFYQHWQGFGVTSEASSANAFEHAGIGMNVYPEDWDMVLPGDYGNLSRTTGTGHAIIFAGWIYNDGGEKIGLRYYGCNVSGDSCPDPDDVENMPGNSGSSFKTEYFDGYGGTVMPELLFIGRVFLPEAF